MTRSLIGGLAAGGMSLLASLAPGCRSPYATVARTYRALPERYTDLSPRAALHLERRVDEAIPLAESCLAGTPESLIKNRVRLYLAKFLVVKHARVLSGERGSPEFPESAEEYFARVFQLTGAIERSPETSRELSMGAMELRGEALWFLGRYPEVIEWTEEFPARYPEYENRDLIERVRILARIKMGDYTTAEEELREALAGATDAEFPGLGNLLYRVLVARGKVDEAREFWEISRSRYAECAGDGDLSRRARLRSGTYLDWSLYQMGWCAFAGGEVELARELLGRSFSQLRSRREAGTLTEPSRYYLNRTIRLRKVIEELAARPAPPLFTEPVDGYRLPAESARGARVLIFSGPRNGVVEELLDFLGRLREEPGMAFEIALVASGDTRLLERKLRRLGRIFSFGRDPTPARDAFLSYLAPPWGVTVVVVDRRGRVAWHHVSPRPIELGTLGRVVERVAEEA